VVCDESVVRVGLSSEAFGGVLFRRCVCYVLCVVSPCVLVCVFLCVLFVASPHPGVRVSGIVVVCFVCFPERFADEGWVGGFDIAGLEMS